MTTWELNDGYGRFKPDLVTYGEAVRGSDHRYPNAIGMSSRVGSS
jgi:hypothetical protein